jgi:hypothetical protein
MIVGATSRGLSIVIARRRSRRSNPSFAGCSHQWIASLTLAMTTGAFRFSLSNNPRNLSSGRPRQRVRLRRPDDRLRRGPRLLESSILSRVHDNAVRRHHKVRWRWVPAFAGTTSDVMRQYARHRLSDRPFQTAHSSLEQPARSHPRSSPRRRGPRVPESSMLSRAMTTPSVVIMMSGGDGSPPEPVIGPAKPDPLAGTTSDVGAASHHYPRPEQEKSRLRNGPGSAAHRCALRSIRGKGHCVRGKRDRALVAPLSRPSAHAAGVNRP